MNLFDGRVTTFAAYDDSGVLLLQAVGGAFRHAYERLAPSEKPIDAMQRAAAALPRRIGALVSMVDPLRSTIGDAVYPPGTSMGDAAQMAEHDLDRSGFAQGVAITAATRSQPESDDGVHVTAGACVTETLTMLRRFAGESGAALQAAYHPAEAIAAALPDSQAIVFLSGSYAMVCAVDRDSFVARVEPRTRADQWVKTSADTIRTMRQQRSSNVARDITVLGDVAQGTLDLFAREASVAVHVPHADSVPPDAALLWWLAYGLMRLTNTTPQRQPLNYAPRAPKGSDRANNMAVAAGAAFGIAAFVVSRIVFSSMVFNEQASVTHTRASLKAARLERAEKRGQVSASISRLGTAADSITVARDSGSSLNVHLVLLGNLAVQHHVWSTGTFGVAVDSVKPELDVSARSMSDFSAFQSALGAQQNVATWTKLDVVQTAGKFVYLSFQVNKQ